MKKEKLQLNSNTTSGVALFRYLRAVTANASGRLRTPGVSFKSAEGLEWKKDVLDYESFQELKGVRHPLRIPVIISLFLFKNI